MITRRKFPKELLKLIQQNGFVPDPKKYNKTLKELTKAYNVFYSSAVEILKNGKAP